jgi:cell division protein FtsB
MVIRPRIRAFLAALGLYALAALFIGYFGINAYTGNRGILAKQDLDQRIADLSELDAAKAERARWERRVALLKADRLDPDMLDERARQLLDYADPRDVTVLISHRDWPASGRKRAPLIGR